MLQLPSLSSAAMRHWSRMGFAVLATTLLAACSQEPTSPAAGGQTGAAGPSPNFSLAMTSASQDVEPYRDRLGASSYRFFFGGPNGGIAASSFSRSEKPSSGSGLSIGRSFGASLSMSGPPVDAPDIMVNDGRGPGLGQSEVALAAYGSTVVAAWNDAVGFFRFFQGLSGFGVSNDGGRTFRDGGRFPRMRSPGFIRIGDPGLAVSEGGDFFFSDLCEDFNTTPVTDGICVTRGRPGGGSFRWGPPVYAHTSDPSLSFLDKEFVAVDRSGTDVFVSYTNFSVTTPFGQIELVASHNGGRRFGPPVIVGPAIGGIVMQGSQPIVGPDGTVYVVFERGWLTSPTPDIVVSTSTDGGASFGAPVVVQTITSIALSPPSGYNRGTINDFPRIDVARDGPWQGRVYVTFHDAVDGDADAWLSYSDDGTGWSAPVKINDDGPGSLQWWPVVHVERGGNVDVTFYDRRLDPGTSVTNMFWAQSTDGGETFRPNHRMSDVGTDWSATSSDIIPNFGDYNAIASSGDFTFAAWGDGRTGNPDVYFSQLKGHGGSK